MYSVHKICIKFLKNIIYILYKLVSNLSKVQITFAEIEFCIATILLCRFLWKIQNFDRISKIFFCLNLYNCIKFRLFWKSKRQMVIKIVSNHITYWFFLSNIYQISIKFEFSLYGFLLKENFFYNMFKKSKDTKIFIK